MKKFIFLLLVSCQLTFFAQSGEFKTYSNGLIYSKNTMSKLSYIVDSLNLKFRTCDLDKAYFSRSQTKGYYFNLKKGKIKQVKTDLENNISFKDLIRKYPDIEVTDTILIVNSKKDYKGLEFVEMAEITPFKRYGGKIKINPKKIKNNESSVFYTSYKNKSLEGFYLLHNFEKKIIPEKYARMIQYTDCLIDTTTVKIKKDAKYGRLDFPKNYESYSHKDKESLLEHLRNTRVVGMCSMDNSPRRHAVNIAKVSAETTKWEVFLRAHLDILNDRFQRVSDGSYAQPMRKTYIKELEELNINLPDLILGISLRIENPSKNHYYSNISRVGRALSETKTPEIFEKEILSMIKDEKLDDYNRILAYFLFKNYNHYVKDIYRNQKNKKSLDTAVNSLPNYLKNKILDKNKV